MNGHLGPVGVFDSGLGGLSVVRELRALLPAETILYYADSAHFPYGELPPGLIAARSQAIADLLLARKAKLVVVACNSASAVALDALRARHPSVPVVGLVPAVKPAVALSRTGRIAVLATPRTAAGTLLAEVIREHAAGAAMTVIPAPGLADLVEAGEMDGPRIESAQRPLLAQAVAARVDTLVLGCTHYPFLAPPIRRLVGPEIVFVDSAAAIARRTQEVLGAADLGTCSRTPGTFSLLTSGDPEAVAALAARLLSSPPPASRLPVAAAARTGGDRYAGVAPSAAGV